MILLYKITTGKKAKIKHAASSAAVIKLETNP